MISRRIIVVASLCAVLLGSLTSGSKAAPPESLEQLVERFTNDTGARLVFEARDLPPGKYHDLMPSLPVERRYDAAVIACRELKKFPPKYLQKIGLSTIGIFESCASKDGDGFRKFDEQLGGYRYFGIYNGKDAVAAAYYTDEQLPLTLHHEVFHHIDGTAQWLLQNSPQPDSRREAFAKIQAGERPYPGLKFTPAELAMLRKRSGGQMLIDAVSAYAKKNPSEDAAETARHFMSNLADSLYQMSEQPQLPGSQRLLHVLDTYSRVPKGEGPKLAWFMAIANDRRQADPLELETLAARLLTLQRELQTATAPNADIAPRVASARQLLDEVEQLVARAKVPAESAKSLAIGAALRTHDLLRLVVQPRDEDRQFTVRGKEDAHNINWTLRNDITGLGQDAERLQRIAVALDSKPAELQASQLKSLRLVARYSTYIADHWRVTVGTGECLDRTRVQLLGVIGYCDPALAKQLGRPELRKLAEAITPDGAIVGNSGVFDANPYLMFVDREIEDLPLRATIRRVQPACVRMNRASGVNISPDGIVLTAGHVAERLQQEHKAEFPDGSTYSAVCIAYDKQLDVALCRLKTDIPLPYAKLAPAAPAKGDRVVCIGQPGLISPQSGQPTGYQPFHVSVGKIRGVAADPLGTQALGGTKHDAWTYWGHSGSPLFNDRGEIVAMHNSWDPDTAMRHAVTYEAIVKFLRGQEVAVRLAPPAR